MSEHGATRRSPPLIEERPFGTTPRGVPVSLFTLRNARGTTASITDFGGIVTSLRVADADLAVGEVILGHDSLEPYLADNRPYLGALVGRYANRIARGIFTLDGETHRLTLNDGPNHLHGGLCGFDRAVWTPRASIDEHGARLELRYLSPDGEEGYPGNLDVRAVYALTDDDALVLDIEATTDRPTLCNLTQHAYFNLDDSPDITEHRLSIRARRFTPVDATLIPTGELREVAGTPMDFTLPTPIGQRIDSDDEQLRFGRGYDHNWVLDAGGGALALAARVEGPRSGRVLEVSTTEPGIQFYSGNFLDGSIDGRSGPLRRRSGLCLETQRFPDSPNQPGFPSAVLRPGELYRSTTAFRFSVSR